MNNHIGERVKSLRIASGMTLVELAEKSSLSTSYLSQIERNRITPSLNTLVNLSKVLNVETRFFFDSDEAGILVHRAGQTPDPNVLSSGLFCHPLSLEDSYAALKVCKMVIPAHTDTEEFEPYRGEEWCFVLSGQLTVVVDRESYVLEAGDSIHYDALLLNYWSNRSDHPCEVIRGLASY